MVIRSRSTRFLLVVVVLLFSSTSFAAFDRDPIEETKTKAVPVTEELLTREGELGPAAPTYKMQGDTSKFLVKKPYEKAETEYLEKPEDEESDEALSDEWFFWDKEDKIMSDTEVVDKK